jgi:hypothetical protein
VAGGQQNWNAHYYSTGVNDEVGREPLAKSATGDGQMHHRRLRSDQPLFIGY